MNQHFFYFLCIVLIGLSCTPEEEKITTDINAKLRFSADSVVFDTVFTDLTSITRRLKVFNDNKNAVEISSIKLAESSSPYNITVNGRSASTFEDVRLLGNDSLLILVDVTIDPSDETLPFLITDQIQFLTNGNEQEVELVAYGQDAVFLNGEILDCNTTWTAGKPYLIYNSVLVPVGCRLTIEPGTRIFSHNASYIFVGGEIAVSGTAEDSVVFTNDRFDEFFINAPGQWGGIVLLQDSGPHKIDHARIRNAQVGIYAGLPDEDSIADLELSNTSIENIGGSDILPDGDFQIIPGFGILSFDSDIYAFNVLINNCQERLIGVFAGGNYRFEHLTLGNFSFDFFRQDAAVLWADNARLGDGSELINPLNVSFQNSILWGNLQDELQISIVESNQTSFFVADNIIRTVELSDILSDGNLINTDPLFQNPEEYNYQLGNQSPAIDAGSDIGVTTDLLGLPRDANPDLGAFEKQD